MTPALDEHVWMVRPPWARLHYCKVRNRWLLLVPERVLFPCPTTVELLERLEQPVNFGSVVKDFSEAYEAPEDVVRADLAELLQDLMEKGYVRRLDA